MNRFIMTILVLFLYGCATPKTETKLIYTEVPSNFLIVKPITKPIDKTTYMTWSPEKRESYLANYISDLIRDLDSYKTNLESLNEWAEKQKKLHNGK